jgi:hypothetical protein
MKNTIRCAGILILFLAAFEATAQQSSNMIRQVHEAIRQGSASTLSNFFHSRIDLELTGTDGNFSRDQAEMILKDFFRKYPVKSYTIRHEGSSDDGSKYSIGLYESKDGSRYRVYVLLKQEDEGLRINQLQFEED